jgi:hypothetical protein
VAANGLELPLEAFAGFLVVGTAQQSVDESRDHVRTQREPGRTVTVALALTSGVLQESRVGEDIR